MKTSIEQEDIQAIASAVTEMLKPMLANNSQVQDFMTIDEVAKFLKTNKGQIYQWVNNSQHGLGSFPYHKAGKLLRFSKDEIVNWMKSNTKKVRRPLEGAYNHLK